MEGLVGMVLMTGAELALSEDADATAAFLSAFIRIRAHLMKGRSVSLEEELLVMDDYRALMAARYAGRFTYDCRIGADAGAGLYLHAGSALEALDALLSAAVEHFKGIRAECAVSLRDHGSAASLILSCIQNGEPKEVEICLSPC